MANNFNSYRFSYMASLLISMFSIFEYLSISITYVISKLIKKQKIGIKKIIGLIIFFISLLLIILFLIVTEVDWLNWYAYSSPFYINVIVRSIEFLIPSIIFIVISILFLKNKK